LFFHLEQYLTNKMWPLRQDIISAGWPSIIATTLMDICLLQAVTVLMKKMDEISKFHPLI